MTQSRDLNYEKNLKSNSFVMLLREWDLCWGFSSVVQAFPQEEWWVAGPLLCVTLQSDFLPVLYLPLGLLQMEPSVESVETSEQP